MLNRIVLSAWLAVASLAAAAQTPNACGDLRNAYGPFDYRKETGKKLALVDSAHFTTQVEMLVKGNTGAIGGDLDYTLRASPNHHRALLSMAKYQEKTQQDPPPAMRYSLDCYFNRAMRFAPDDTVVRLIYAQALQRRKRQSDAFEQLSALEKMALENPMTWRNIGLLYADMNDFDSVKRVIERLDALGYPAPTLEQRLSDAIKQPAEPASDPVGSR